MTEPAFENWLHDYTKPVNLVGGELIYENSESCTFLYADEVRTMLKDAFEAGAESERA